MKALFYKGEDINLTFSSTTNMSGYTKVVKYFTPFSVIKTATVTAVDNFSFTAKLAKADTADLNVGTLNIVLEFTDGSSNKMISKTIECKLADAYVDGGERENSNISADIVFAQNQNIEVNFLSTDGVVASLNSKVGKTGDETIAGVKTFSSSPVIPAPTTDMQAATKKYVDFSKLAYINGNEITYESTQSGGWEYSEFICVLNSTKLKYYGRANNTIYPIRFFNSYEKEVGSVIGTGGDLNFQTIEFLIPEGCSYIKVQSAYEKSIITVVESTSHNSYLKEIGDNTISNLSKYINTINRDSPQAVDVGGSWFETALIPIPDNCFLEYEGRSLSSAWAVKFYNIYEEEISSMNGMGVDIVLQTITNIQAPANAAFVKSRFVFSSGSIKVISQNDSSFLNRAAIVGIKEKAEEQKNYLLNAMMKVYSNNLKNEPDTFLSSINYGLINAVYKIPLTRVKRINVELILPKAINKTAANVRILEGKLNNGSIVSGFETYHVTPSQVKSIEGKPTDETTWSMFPKSWGGITAVDYFPLSREVGNRDSLGDRIFSLWFKGYASITTEPTAEEITARSTVLQNLQDMYVNIASDTFTIGRDGIGEDGLVFNGGATSTIFTTSLKVDGNYKLVKDLYEELIAANLADFYLKHFSLSKNLSCSELVQYGKFKLVGKYSQQTVVNTNETNTSLIYDSFPLFIFAANRENRVVIDIVVSDDKTVLTTYCDGKLNSNLPICDYIEMGNAGSDAKFENLSIYYENMGEAEIIGNNIASEKTPLIHGFMMHELQDTYQDSPASIEGQNSVAYNTSISKMIDLSRDLRGKGYNILTAEDLADYYKGFKKLPKKNAFIIADDFRLVNWMFTSIDKRSSFNQMGLKIIFAMIIENCISDNLDKNKLLSALQNGCSFVSHSYYHDVPMSLKSSIALFYELNKARQYMNDNYFNQDIFTFNWYGGRMNTEIMLEYCGFSVSIESGTGTEGGRNSVFSNRFRLKRFDLSDATEFPLL